MNNIFKNLIKEVAPILGSALGGPIGGLATTAISRALLGKDNAPEHELIDALQAASPDVLLKLKQADNDFKIKMEQMGIDIIKMAHNDVANARQREIEMARTSLDPKSKSLAFSLFTMPLLALLVTLGFFASMYLIAFLNIDTEAEQILNILSGILGTCFVQIISYYFGSSMGSRMKDK